MRRSRLRPLERIEHRYSRARLHVPPAQKPAGCEKRLKRIACWTSTVVRLTLDLFRMSRTRTSLRRQKSSMYCSWAASSGLKPLTRDAKVQEARPQSSCGRGRVRGMIDHVFGEVDRTAGPGVDCEGDLTEVPSVNNLVGVRARGCQGVVDGACEDQAARSVAWHRTMRRSLE